LAIAVLDCQPEDEVIVPAITWASTANVVELCGARTVFADVDRQTLCIDPMDVARRITSRTRAIIPVHYAGQPADLDALRKIAAAHQVLCLEDAAHALGTAYRGAEIGATGEMVVFSFHPTKNITTGEGGMILCRDAARAARIRRLRFHGIERDAWARSQGGGSPAADVWEPGWKFNMLDIQAAIGLRQLPKLERFIAARTALAERYRLALVQVPEVQPIGLVEYPASHAWHLFVVRLGLEELGCTRDEFVAAMNAERIGCGVHYPALHLQSHYRERYGYQLGMLPVADDMGSRICSLPLYPGLTPEEQERVVAAVLRVVGRLKCRIT
jgi:UDP-4-amino-4-deoxy-L-arabinose-oxoglutarate aminotransferase